MSPGLRRGLATVLSAVLFALVGAFDAAWPLVFIALVPWLRALDECRGVREALAQGLAMTLLFTLGVFWWFGLAIGSYTGTSNALALAVLVVAAPVLQPQVWAFALVRHAARQRFGSVWALAAGAAAWVGMETLWPKLLGDTLGHALHGVDALRASAAFGGAAGLTVLVLLANEAIARALAPGTPPWRTRARPLVAASVLAALTTGAGLWRLHQLRTQAAEDVPVLRVAMVQANLVDYERRRREQGSYAVVREVLDTHFAMSASAVRDHGADALLWSETVYPTTFGQARSADGAALDEEIAGFATAMGTPLLFGTYERDAFGEYNAAVLLEPEGGRLASYRKTHPFPFTETVPGWLDGPRLRRLLPWTGTWRAGDGARVLPLRSADGRSIEVQPLICLDDVHPQLAIDGARLGAQALVGLSNDAWFTHWPRGGRLHLAVAAFRSAETGLPQLRVTTNGMSAVIDESGKVLVHTAMGQQAVLTGHLPDRTPLPTLMLRWGDWVGRAGLALLAGLALWAGLSALHARALRRQHALNAPTDFAAEVMPRPLRIGLALLRASALIALIMLAHGMATRIGWQVATVAQLQTFGLGVVLPLVIAWGLRRASRATLRVTPEALHIERPRQRIEIPRASIARVSPWVLPQPGPGLDLVLGSGRRWALSMEQPSSFVAALGTTGGLAHDTTLPSPPPPRPAFLTALFESRNAARHRVLDHAALKFGLFPLLPALVAFRLHQMIAFGGPFGEWLSVGAGAWFTGLALWWSAWSLGLMLFAAVLRIGLEAIAALGQAPLSPSRQAPLRYGLEALGRAAYYLGVPAWLALRLLSS